MINLREEKGNLVTRIESLNGKIKNLGLESNRKQILKSKLVDELTHLEVNYGPVKIRFDMKNRVFKVDRIYNNLYSDLKDTVYEYLCERIVENLNKGIRSTVPTIKEMSGLLAKVKNYMNKLAKEANL